MEGTGPHVSGLGGFPFAAVKLIVIRTMPNGASATMARNALH